MLFCAFNIGGLALGNQVENDHRSTTEILKPTRENILYVDLENALPKVEDMMFICVDKNQSSKIWFEFTNFKFLVNAKSPNGLVRIYIGGVDEKYDLENVYRQPIGIYDPESAFVFQDAIIKFWNNLPENHIRDSNLMLFRALEVGYSALSYHFGFSDSLIDIADKNSYPISGYQENQDKEKSVFNFNELLYQRYSSEVKGIDRLMAKEAIEKCPTVSIN